MTTRTVWALAVLGAVTVVGCKKADDTKGVPAPGPSAAGGDGRGASPATLPTTGPAMDGPSAPAGRMLPTRPALPEMEPMTRPAAMTGGPSTRPTAGSVTRLAPLPGTMPTTRPSIPLTDFNK